MSVEHVPSVGFAVTVTTTGPVPLGGACEVGAGVAAGVPVDEGVTDDVPVVGGDAPGAGPMGAPVAGTLARASVPGPVAAGCVPARPGTPPDAGYGDGRIANRPASTSAQASPAAAASSLTGRRRVPASAAGSAATGEVTGSSAAAGGTV